MGVLFSEEQTVLWITLSSISFYGLSTLFDLGVITKWKNGLAKTQTGSGNILEVYSA